MSSRPDRWLGTLLVTASALLLPFSANATAVAFDAFGPADSYDTGFRYSTGQGFRFEAAASGPLARITVALGRDSESVTGASFVLFTDADGSYGVFLETLTTANDTPALPATGAVVPIDSLTQPMLVAGQSYWLAFGDVGPIGSLWFFNDQGLTGLRSTGSEAVLPAFRVEVVPEPGTGSLLLGGLLLLRTGRRSRALRD